MQEQQNLYHQLDTRICKETGTPQLILVRKASIEGPVDRNI